MARPCPRGGRRGSDQDQPDQLRDLRAAEPARVLADQGDLGRGCHRYRNPDEDVPPDFEVNRAAYYQELDQPLDAGRFTADLQQTMTEHLTPRQEPAAQPRCPPAVARQEPDCGDTAFPAGGGGWARAAQGRARPTLADDQPAGHAQDPDLRTGFTEAFASSGDRETLDRAALRRRLLLCLYGMGTNTGLRRVAAGQEDVSYKELLHGAFTKPLVKQKSAAASSVRSPNACAKASLAPGGDYFSHVL